MKTVLLYVIAAVLVFSVSVYAEDPHWTDLMQAARDGYPAKLSKALKASHSINARTKDGRTALMLGACSGKESHIIVKMLLKGGANINDVDSDGKTALIYAVEHHNIDTTKYLIDAGSDLNVKTKYGRTALLQCVVSRNYSKFEILKQLITAGADVNVMDNNGYSAINWVVREGFNSDPDEVAEVIKLMIGKKVDLTKKDATGMTPLAWARQANKKYMIDLFIKAGASE